MKNVLDSLKKIPGVIGLFFYNSKEGIVEREMPILFKDEKLDRIGKVLAKVYSSGSSNFSDLAEISFLYEESGVIVRGINNIFFLIVLYEPSINLNLLTMSLNLAVDELKESIENRLETDVSTSKEKAEKEVAVESESKDVNADFLLNSSEMADSLKGMQEALFAIMGPMAKIIFSDTLDQWASSGECCYDSMNKLVDKIAEEIGDPEKTEEFKSLISKYLKEEK